MKYEFSYLVALGSNIEPRLRYIERALTFIKNLPTTSIVKVATIYENPPIGNCDQMFLNTCALFSSNITPEIFMENLLHVEQQLGRVRAEISQNRTIDLDLIIAKQGAKPLVLQSSHLILPHPRMCERPFVMIPAKEIFKGLRP